VRLLLLFLLGGLCGSLAGLLLYRGADTIVAGASGAGLCLLVCAARLPGRPLPRAGLLLLGAAVGLSGLLFQGDNAAHLGGVLCGLLLWPLLRP
jgi:membrane associated rhomboid family serine protease